MAVVRKMRQQFAQCTRQQSTTAYAMVSPCFWYIYARGHIFSVEFPEDFPLSAAKLLAVSFACDQICTDGAASAAAVAEIAAEKAAGAQKSPDLAVFAPILAEIAASYAGYSAAWTGLAPEVAEFRAHIVSLGAISNL